MGLIMKILKLTADMNAVRIVSSRNGYGGWVNNGSTYEDALLDVVWGPDQQVRTAAKEELERIRGSLKPYNFLARYLLKRTLKKIQ